MKRILSLTLLCTIGSCSRLQTLNTEPHYYSQTPDHIILLQIPGFKDDHIPLLKYNNQQSENKTWFEKADCLGKMYNFTLTQLRPEASISMLSQLLGSKNVKNECGDISNSNFIWKMYKDLDYKVSIIEKGMKETDSLEKFKDCTSPEKSDFKNTRMWEMKKKSPSNDQVYFHYQDSVEKVKSYLNEGIYFDKSCQQGDCYSSLLSNVKSLYGNLIKENSKTFLLIRDFSYLNSLKNKNLSEATEKLKELDQLLNWLQTIDDKKILIVVSTAESINFDFPKEGKEWEEFVQTGKNFNFKNASLVSSIFAKGPMSENFCGFFEESDLYKRLQLKVPPKVFNWDILNPFSK